MWGDSFSSTLMRADPVLLMTWELQSLGWVNDAARSQPRLAGQPLAQDGVYWGFLKLLPGHIIPLTLTTRCLQGRFAQVHRALPETCTGSAGVAAGGLFVVYSWGG